MLLIAWAVILIAEGKGNIVLWVIVIIIALCAVVSVIGGNGKVMKRRKLVLICHPHYDDDTDYECSVYGARFFRASDDCPKCGTWFVEKKTDYEEYEEEEDDEEDNEEDD